MRVPAPKVTIAVVVALLAAGLAVVAVRAADSGGGKVRASATSTSSSSSSTSTALTTTTTAAPPPTTAAAIPPALQATFAQIQAQVAQLRGLPWLAPLDIAVAPDAQFEQQLTYVNNRDLHVDRLQGDGVTLKVLQLIPQNLDYVKTVFGLYNGAVLGFYDPKTKKLLVRANSTTLSPEERITVAHEMDHALTDQHFAFGPATYALDLADKEEQGTGFTGLLEGDAKTLEAQWGAKYLTASERNQAASQSNGSASIYLTTPQYMVDSLLWPYTTGKAFVTSRYRAGGWAAVNAVYGRPPDSTLVVNQPQLYLSGYTWSPPPTPNLAAATGCTPVRNNTLGQFTMEEMLAKSVGDITAEAASLGWSGDAFATVQCGSARGFADRWTTPDTASAGKLSSALSSWAGDWSGGHTAPAADGRFSGPSGAGRIVVKSTTIDIILGDDAPTADRVSTAMGD
ncbi:MAG: hypothetical protein JO148_02400 [Acidimicrobiia bacterium]|nr:hypothetical protein [Acidimicrobiia bacterium]